MLCPLLKPFRSFEKSQRNVIKRWVTLTVSQLQLNRWLAHLFRKTPMKTDLPKIAYNVIYADPPWRYDNGTPGREIERHYPTMSDDEICALQVPVAKDSILYLWATAPRLESGLDVLRAWGFRYKTQAVWDKEKVGMGFWFRGQHEILMVGTRGDVSPPDQADRIPSVIRCPRGRHSSKPDYVRDQIEKWYPKAKRLEMFSRLKRPNWDVFGNQVEYDLLSGNDEIHQPTQTTTQTELI